MIVALLFAAVYYYCFLWELNDNGRSAAVSQTSRSTTEPSAADASRTAALL